MNPRSTFPPVKGAPPRRPREAQEAPAGQRRIAWSTQVQQYDPSSATTGSAGRSARHAQTAELSPALMASSDPWARQRPVIDEASGPARLRPTSSLPSISPIRSMQASRHAAAAAVVDSASVGAAAGVAKHAPLVARSTRRVPILTKAPPPRAAAPVKVRAGVFGVRHPALPGVVHFDYSWNLDKAADSTRAALDAGTHPCRGLVAVLARRHHTREESRRAAREARRPPIAPPGHAPGQADAEAITVARRTDAAAAAEAALLNKPFDIFVVREFDGGDVEGAAVTGGALSALAGTWGGGDFDLSAQGQRAPRQLQVRGMGSSGSSGVADDDSVMRSDTRDLEATLRASVASSTARHRHAVSRRCLEAAAAGVARRALRRWGAWVEHAAWLERFAAAVVIQGQARRRFSRDRAGKLRVWVAHRICIAIWTQRVIRGFRGRKRATRIRRRLRREWACATLQRVWRGVRVRAWTSRRLELLKSRQRLENARALLRRGVDRWAAKRREHNLTSRRAVRQQAADRLTAWWRSSRIMAWRLRRRVGSVGVQTLWRGYAEREFGAWHWEKRRQAGVRANAALVVGGLLRRLLGRARRKIIMKCIAKVKAAECIQCMRRTVLARREMAIRREQRREEVAAGILALHCRAWLRHQKHKRRWAASAAERAAAKAMLLVQQCCWRWKARRQLRTRTWVKRCFNVCALCLTPKPKWFHDATEEKLCGKCLFKTQKALREHITVNEDGSHCSAPPPVQTPKKAHARRATPPAETGPPSLEGPAVDEAEPRIPRTPSSSLGEPWSAGKLADSRPGSRLSISPGATSHGSPPNSRGRGKRFDPKADWTIGRKSGMLKPPLSTQFAGHLAPLDLIVAYPAIKSAVATLERLFLLREEQTSWALGVGSMVLDISDGAKLGMGINLDGSVGKVARGGQADKGGIRPGSRIVSVESLTSAEDPVPNGRVPQRSVVGSLEDIRAALDLCREYDSGAARIGFLDSRLGRCELRGCQRAIKAVFRSTSSNAVKHASKRRPKILRTCLHCAAVLRDEYHPASQGAGESHAPPPGRSSRDSVLLPMPATDHDAAGSVRFVHGPMPPSGLTPLATTDRDYADVDFPERAADVVEWLPGEFMTGGVVTEFTATAAAVATVAPGTDFLKSTGSALSYFQSRRLWVGLDEFDQEKKAADHICAFMLFTIRRHRWAVTIRLFRAKRTSSATTIQQAWRGRCLRQSLGVVNTLNSIFIESLVPALLRRKRFLGVMELSKCIVSPVLHIVLDPPPPETRKRTPPIKPKSVATNTPAPAPKQQESQFSGKKDKSRRGREKKSLARSGDDSSKSIAASAAALKKSKAKPEALPTKAALALALADMKSKDPKKAALAKARVAKLRAASDETDTPEAKIPSVSVAAFLFRHPRVGARLVALRKPKCLPVDVDASPPMKQSKSAKPPPPPPGGGFGSGLTVPLQVAPVEAVVRAAAASLLVREGRRSLACKRAWRLYMLKKRGQAHAWLKFNARCQWAACFIQTRWRGSKARAEGKRRKVLRNCARAVSDLACNPAAFLARAATQGWFTRVSGCLGNATVSPAALLAAALCAPPLPPNPFIAPDPFVKRWLAPTAAIPESSVSRGAGEEEDPDNIEHDNALPPAPPSPVPSILSAHSVRSDASPLPTPREDTASELFETKPVLSEAVLGTVSPLPAAATVRFLGPSAGHDGHGAVMVHLAPPPPREAGRGVSRTKSSFPHYSHAFAAPPPAPGALPGCLPLGLGRQLGVGAKQELSVGVALSVRLSRPTLVGEEDARGAFQGLERTAAAVVQAHDMMRRALVLAESKTGPLDDPLVGSDNCGDDSGVLVRFSVAMGVDGEPVPGDEVMADLWRCIPAVHAAPYCDGNLESCSLAASVPLVAHALHEHWRSERRAEGGNLNAESPNPCWKKMGSGKGILGQQQRRKHQHQHHQGHRSGGRGDGAAPLDAVAVEFLAWFDPRLHAHMHKFVGGVHLVDIDRPLHLLPPSLQQEMLETAVTCVDAIRRFGAASTRPWIDPWATVTTEHLEVAKSGRGSDVTIQTVVPVGIFAVAEAERLANVNRPKHRRKKRGARMTTSPGAPVGAAGPGGVSFADRFSTEARQDAAEVHACARDVHASWQAHRAYEAGAAENNIGGGSPFLPAWAVRAGLDRPYLALPAEDRQRAAGMVRRAQWVLAGVAADRARMLAADGGCRVGNRWMLESDRGRENVKQAPFDPIGTGAASLRTPSLGAVPASPALAAPRSVPLVLRLEIIRVAVGADPLTPRSVGSPITATEEQEVTIKVRWIARDPGSRPPRFRLRRCRFQPNGAAEPSDAECRAFTPGGAAHTEGKRPVSFLPVPPLYPGAGANWAGRAAAACDGGASRGEGRASQASAARLAKVLAGDHPWLELELERGAVLKRSDLEEARRESKEAASRRRADLRQHGGTQMYTNEEDCGKMEAKPTPVVASHRTGRRPGREAAEAARASAADASPPKVEWSLTSGDLWRCLVSGKPVTLAATPPADGAVTVLITAEPEIRTEARLLCEAIIADFIRGDLFRALPSEHMAWAAALSTVDDDGATFKSRIRKPKATSLLDDTFSTEIKVMVVDLHHEEAEAGDGDRHRAWLTQQEVFVVLKHRGKPKALAEAFPPWKRGAHQMPHAQSLGLLGGTPHPRPVGALAFNPDAPDHDLIPATTTLELPCPVWKEPSLGSGGGPEDDHEESEEEDYDEEVASNISAKTWSVAAAAPPPSLPLKLPIQRAGQRVAPRGDVGHFSGSSVVTTESYSPAEVEQGFRQLVFEVFSKHPGGPVFRGQVTLGYSELEQLCETGYNRFALRRRPEDSARGIRIRMTFSSPDPALLIEEEEENMSEGEPPAKSEPPSMAPFAPKVGLFGGKCGGFSKFVGGKLKYPPASQEGKPDRSPSAPSVRLGGRGGNRHMVPDLLQIRTTLPSRSTRTVPFEPSKRPPSRFAWDAATTAAAAGHGTRLNGTVLDTSWEGEPQPPPPPAPKRWGEAAFVPERPNNPDFGPRDGSVPGAAFEDVCHWDDADVLPVDVPLRPLLRILGLSQFSHVFCHELGLHTTRQIAKWSDTDLQAAVRDHVDARLPPKTKVAPRGDASSAASTALSATGATGTAAVSTLSAGSTSGVTVAATGTDSPPDTARAAAIKAAAAAEAANPKEAEEPLVLARPHLTRLRTALHALGPRVHRGDNPTDTGEALLIADRPLAFAVVDGVSGDAGNLRGEEKDHGGDGDDDASSIGSSKRRGRRTQRSARSDSSQSGDSRSKTGKGSVARGGGGASVGSSKSGKKKPGEASTTGATAASKLLVLDDLPHHDKRVLRKDVWVDIEFGHQLSGTLDLAAIRDPADYAEAPAPAAPDFCKDRRRPTRTSHVASVPKLSLATLFAVYRDQATQPPEVRDSDDKPRRFWVPVYSDEELIEMHQGGLGDLESFRSVGGGGSRASGRTSTSGSASVGFSESLKTPGGSPSRGRTLSPQSRPNSHASLGRRAASLSPTATPGSPSSTASSASSFSSASSSRPGTERNIERRRRPLPVTLSRLEIEAKAATSRRVLGMWVVITTRRRPSTFSPKHPVAGASTAASNKPTSTSVASAFGSFGSSNSKISAATAGAVQQQSTEGESTGPPEVDPPPLHGTADEGHAAGGIPEMDIANVQPPIHEKTISTTVDESSIPTESAHQSPEELESIELSLAEPPTKMSPDVSSSFDSSRNGAVTGFHDDINTSSSRAQPPPALDEIAFVPHQETPAPSAPDEGEGDSGPEGTNTKTGMGCIDSCCESTGASMGQSKDPILSLPATVSGAASKEGPEPTANAKAKAAAEAGRKAALAHRMRKFKFMAKSGLVHQDEFAKLEESEESSPLDPSQVCVCARVPPSLRPCCLSFLTRACALRPITFFY